MRGSLFWKPETKDDTNFYDVNSSELAHVWREILSTHRLHTLTQQHLNIDMKLELQVVWPTFRQWYYPGEEVHGRAVIHTTAAESIKSIVILLYGKFSGSRRTKTTLEGYH